MSKINVVIPMAGLGSRFVSAGYKKPKPFIDVDGKPMIVRVLENLKIENAHYILIARKEHIEEEINIVKKILKNFNTTIIEIDYLTEGSACTVIHARKYINSNIPLLIANSDQIIDFDINDFITDASLRRLDGSILTFFDEEKNIKWSFAKVDENNIVTEVREKKPISNFATVGIYYFSKGSDFINGGIDMIVKNERTTNEFYTCPVYNELIKNGSQIGIFNIEFSKMHGIGTPEDLKSFILKRL